MAERLGFQLEGIERDGEWLYDRFVDLAVYSRLAGYESTAPLEGVPIGSQDLFRGRNPAVSGPIRWRIRQIGHLTCRNGGTIALEPPGNGTEQGFKWEMSD